MHTSHSKGKKRSILAQIILNIRLLITKLSGLLKMVVSPQKCLVSENIKVTTAQRTWSSKGGWAPEDEEGKGGLPFFPQPSQQGHPF